MKLEVGMYVRTDKGLISQIKDFKEHYTKGKRLVDSCHTKEVVENYLNLGKNQCEFIESIDYSIPPCYPSDEELEKIKSHIVKASHNIIDLIEVGDYVNGYPVAYITDLGNEFGKRLSFGDETCVVASKFNFDKVYIYKEDIKSIVTKEQFESMEYKII